MLKRDKITSVVSNLITEEADVEQYLIDDYEKLRAKCEEVISKIKKRKVKKPKSKESMVK